MRKITCKYLVLIIIGLTSLSNNLFAENFLVKDSVHVVKKGDRIKISFQLQKPCDIQITIKQKNKIIRHLAGGLVGISYSSAPFQKGLQQTVFWDGLDDFKKPVSMEGLEVEVGAKLKADFDKIIGWDGNYLTTARGFCFGKDSSMILIGGEQLLHHHNATIITRYKKSGKYLNQIFPPAGGLDKKDRLGMPTATLSTGKEVPVIYHMGTRAMLPAAVFDFRTNPILSHDGKSIYFLSGTGFGLGRITHTDIRGGRRILKLNIDGSVPKDYLGPIVISENDNGYNHVGEGSIALSADGKSMYVTGLRRMIKKGKYAKKSNSLQVVYKVSLRKTEDNVSIFCGILSESGSDNNHLHDPEQVDVDKEGNVYVTDKSNHRVQIFNNKGHYIKSIALKGVSSCRVHNPTGSVYLFSADSGRILKYRRYNDSKPIFEHHVKLKKWSKFPLDKTSILEIDKNSKEPRLAILTLLFNRYQLTILNDTGKKLNSFYNPLKKFKKKKALAFNRNVCVTDHWVIGQGYDAGAFRGKQPHKFNKETGAYEGEALLDRISGSKEFIVGKDGYFYQQNGGYGKTMANVKKYDQELKHVPFKEAKSAEGTWHGHGGASGFFVNRHGSIFSVCMKSWRNQTVKDSMGLRLKEFNARGKLVSENRVYAENNVYLAGVVTDSKGNIYIGARVSKGGNSIPEWFANNLPENSEHNYPRLNYKQYAPIIKFGPKGGAFLDDKKGDYYGYRVGSSFGNVTIKGGKSIGKCIMIPIRGGKDGVHCYCETSRFDIDFYDRLIVPDLHRYCVRILDTEGKEILRIGSYGNMDNAGPDSIRPKPSIAFNWILRTVVSEGKIYVADANNRRIIVIKLSCKETINKNIEN